MMLLLVAGIALLAMSALQVARPRVAADRDRRRALDRVRASADVTAAAVTDSRRSIFGRVAALLAQVHRRVWRKQTDHEITLSLRRAGVSRRFTAELFMAGRVAATAFGVFVGFTMAHGMGRILLGLVFAAAGVILPGFLLSKAATRRAERIDQELPHFVDQLALVIEAGVSVYAAVEYLLGSHEGALAQGDRPGLTQPCVRRVEARG